MNPQIAAFAFGVLILGLFVLDRDPKVRTSKALWIPLVWFLIGASRNISEWLLPPHPSSERYLEGNALDRSILTGLLTLAIIVLVCRARQAGAILKRGNAAIL